MIPAEDQHVFRIFPLDRVDVLIYGVGGPLVPLFRRAQLRRNGENEFATIIGEDIPPEPDVPIQRIGFILCKDADSLQLRIDAVRQRKVDYSINPSKRYRWFGPV